MALASPNIALHEVVACTKRVVSKRAGSVGFFWLGQLTLNLGPSPLNPSVCKGCTLVKYTKSTFHDRDNEAHEIFERIHSTFYGPFLTASTARHKYFFILLMTCHKSVGYSSCRINMRHSPISYNSRHWLRKKSKIK